jgi:hypothetical protein
MGASGFVKDELTANPLAMRDNGPLPWWTSARTAWLVFAVIALPPSIPLVSIILHASIIPNGQVLVMFFRNMVEYLLIAIPLATAGIAPIFFVQELKRETPLRLTGSAPGIAIVRGYLLIIARRMRLLWAVAVGLLVPTWLNMYWLYSMMPRPCIGTWFCILQYRAMVALESTIIMGGVTLLIISATLLALVVAFAAALVTRSTLISLMISMAALAVCISVAGPALNTIPSTIAANAVPYVPEFEGHVWAGLMTLFALIAAAISAGIYSQLTRLLGSKSPA